MKTKLQTGSVIVRTTDVATYAFGSDHAARTTAWEFHRACDAAKISSGFPSLRAPYTVQVGIATWMDREAADKLASGAPVVDYAFKGSEYTL